MALRDKSVIADADSFAGELRPAQADPVLPRLAQFQPPLG